MAEVRVVAGRDGRCLVQDGSRIFLVPEAMAPDVATAGGLARWRDLVAISPAAAPTRRVLWLRLVILPGAWVDRLAISLARLAGTPALLLLAGGGVLSAVAAFAAGIPLSLPLTTTGALLGLGLFLLTALWHELGHAAALRREGVPAGPVGFGLLWVVPVLYCDVTAAAILPRRGRLRVDAAGMVFQLASAGICAVLASTSGSPAVGFAALGAAAAVIWSAAPLLHADGHWLLLDLLEMPALEAAPPARWRFLAPRARAVRLAMLLLWRLASSLTLVLAGGLLPWRLARLAGRHADRFLPAAAVLALQALLILVLAVGTWNAWRRALGLLRAAIRDVTVAELWLARAPWRAILSDGRRRKERP